MLCVKKGRKKEMSAFPQKCSGVEIESDKNRKVSSKEPVPNMYALVQC